MLSWINVMGFTPPEGRSVKIPVFFVGSKLWSMRRFRYRRLTITDRTRGSSVEWMLKQANIGMFRRWNPIIDLPRTFQEAMGVALRFSIRYIWIDRLCIIQDSDSDWEQEALTMRSVYANTACNIAAAAANDPEGGLFRRRKMCKVGPAQIRRGESTKIVRQEPYFESLVTDAELHQRGWVFQERLLSPRTLHFTDGQIFFECFKREVCEVFRHQAPTADPRMKNLGVWFDISKTESDKTKLMPQTCFHQWCVWVEEYSQCALTRPGDKLLAFSGVADLVREVTHDVYIAGLWSSRFAESLMWRTSMRFRQKPRQSPSPIRSNRSNLGAPSWSWASQERGVSYDYIRQPSPLLSRLPSQSSSSSDASLKNSAWVDQAPDGPSFVLIDGYVFLGGVRDDEIWIEDQSLGRIRCAGEIDSAPFGSDVRELLPEEDEKRRFAFLVCLMQNDGQLSGLILQHLEKGRSEIPEHGVISYKRVGTWYLHRPVEVTDYSSEEVPAVYRRIGFTFVEDEEAGDSGCRVAETPEEMRRTIRLY